MRDQLQGATGVDVRSVPVRRSTPPGEHPSDLGAVAYARGGEVTLPAELGPLTAEPARSLLAHELTHVAQHRRAGGAGPAESTPAGAALERAAASAQAAVAELPLAAPPAPRAATETETETATAAGAVPARSRRSPSEPLAAPSPAAPSGAVRRAVDAGPPPSAPPAGEPAAPAAASSGAGPAGGDTGAASGDSAEIEEQVRKLYRPLLAQLRRDLLVERERAGHLIDRR